MIGGIKTLIGVTSRTTDPRGGCHKDSVYTNVAAYQDFIATSLLALNSSQKMPRQAAP
jgi:secreted trypsin-like serine protease